MGIYLESFCWDWATWHHDQSHNALYHKCRDKNQLEWLYKWFFCPQCGTPQGDPISLYLYVLCMDNLSHIIDHEVQQQNWKAFQIGKNGMKISHLMFTDGLLLFGKANEKHIHCVNKTLSAFCNLLGQGEFYYIIIK